jgi:hypothetical protein
VQIHKKTFIPYLLIGFLCCAAVLGGCRDDEYNDSPDVRLRFSTDSVHFDTVFTTVGSATQIFKVYNPDDSFINISRVRLQNDANNSYRINVDGIAAEDVRDVEIGPNDSIYVFVEVTVTPDQNELYPFVEGEIVFEVNGNEQEVKLVSWGWDAIFYVPTVFPTNGLPDYTIIDSLNTNITWTNEKPIVVYGYAVVDEGQELNIMPGTQVFFHAGAGLWVFQGATIKAEGTIDQPITFQGDRLESFYDEQPGQWDRIWINDSNGENVFRNCLIKNNFIGLQLEPLPFGDDPNTDQLTDIVLENVVIRNNSIAGIFTKSFDIEADNCLLSSAGQYLLVATGHGAYNFDQCTFANNWRFGIRQTPAVFINNIIPIDETTIQAVSIGTSRFRNCIIDGNTLNELGLDFETPGQVDVDLVFQTTIVRSEEEVIQPYLDDSLFEGNVFVNQSPGFIDFAGGDFRPAEDAFLRGNGFGYFGLPATDLIGTPYSNPRPLGALEFLPE